MKVRDAIKMIERDGWTLKGTRGDHASTGTERSRELWLSLATMDRISRLARIEYSETGGTEMGYAVIIENAGTGYSAFVPDLSGCISVGRTRAEMDRNIREAIELYLDELGEQGDPIPTPTTDTEHGTD